MMLCDRLAREELVGAAGFGDLFANDLALADETGGKAGRAAALGGGATQYKSVAAVLDDCLCFGASISAGDLGDGLKSKNAAAAEFAQAREGVFEAVDRA